MKNFDIRAIVQFGSKTFGTTGTNTVVLFLQKNSEPPVKADIVRDNVSAILERDDLQVASDRELLASYCKRLNLPKEDYVAFIKSARQDADYTRHKSHPYFAMYVREFEEAADFRKTRAERRGKAFYEYALQIEREKLYYFALVHKQHTLVVTAPSDNSEQERFLGYSWSNRKGDEGIKIKSSAPQNACGLLYNVYDEEGSIARSVKDAFLGIYRSGTYTAAGPLQDMIDFSRTTFDKAIRPNAPSEPVQIESRWPLVRLGEICEIQKGKSITSANIEPGAVKVIAGGVDYAYLHNESNRPANIITVSASGANAGYVNFWDEPIFASDCTTILAKDVLTTKYVFNILKANQEIIFCLQKGTAQPHVYSNDLKSVQIPLPPLDVQKSIVAECEAVDAECRDAQKEIEKLQESIFLVVGTIEGTETKLSDIVELKNGLNYTKSSTGEIIRIVGVKDFQNYFSPKIDELETVQIDGKLSAGYLIRNDDILVVRSNGSKSLVGRCILVKGLDSQQTSFSGFTIRIRVKTENILPIFLCYLLRSETVRTKMMTDSKGSNIQSISQDAVLRLTVPVPPLAEQQRIVAEIAALEERIAASRRVLAEAPQRRQAILDRWLD